MADDIEDPSIGYGCEYWLADEDGTLVELVGVFNMAPPNDIADKVEVTHYKSPDMRKQYIAGLLDAEDIVIEMNYAPGSPTDQLCVSSKRKVRAFKMVIKDALDGDYLIEGTNTVRGYARNLPVGDRKTAQLTVSLNGGVTETPGS